MVWEQDGQSEFDQRQLYHTRLHEAILMCHRSNFKNNYYGWYKALIVLRLELSAHLRTEEEKDLVSNSFKPLTPALINKSLNNISKFNIFMKAQEAIHQILRNRGLDVPIYEENYEL